MKKFADLIIDQRVWFLTAISLITLLFIFLLKDLKVYTKFADLLPQGNEYIKVSVFVPFSVLYIKEPLKLDYLWAGLCLVCAAYFMFRSKFT